MKTIISLAGAGPAAVYNLWKELNSTNNVVEVVFMDFSNNEQASPGLKKLGNKLAVERVCGVLKQKERDFILTIKNIDTFTKETLWPMEVAYYAINKFKANQADKLSFHFIKDEENEYDIQCMNGMKNRLKELSPTKGTISFPLYENNLSKLHIYREVPAYLKPYLVNCLNVSEEGVPCGVCVKCKHHLIDMDDLAKGLSSEDFLTKKLNVLGRGPEPFSGTKLFGYNGNYEVDNHPVYGSFVGPTIPTNYTFTEVPDKYIFTESP